MLKVKPPDSCPPEKGGYVRRHDCSSDAVCVAPDTCIALDTFDLNIPMELSEVMTAGVNSVVTLNNKRSEDA